MHERGSGLISGVLLIQHDNSMAESYEKKNHHTTIIIDDRQQWTAN